MTDTRQTRQLRRGAVIVGITVVVLILVIVGVYAVAFVILSPLMG